MLSGTKNSELIAEYSDLIGAEQTRKAFCLLVGLSARLRRFSCYPEHKGKVRDSRFYADNSEQEFAFIPNNSWLLFYFRLPAVRSGRYTYQELSRRFDSVQKNTKGEWTVRLRNCEDVEHLWDYLDLE